MVMDLDHIDLTEHATDNVKLSKDIDLAYKARKGSGAYNAIFKQYRDPGTKYAFAILEGNEVAGVDMKLSAFRHLQDLTRIGSKDFPYTFSLQKCHEVLNFASLCPDPDAGKPLPLGLWQQAILCWSQGWRNEADERRFHTFWAVQDVTTKIWAI